MTNATESGEFESSRFGTAVQDTLGGLNRRGTTFLRPAISLAALPMIGRSYSPCADAEKFYYLAEAGEGRAEPACREATGFEPTPFATIGCNDDPSPDVMLEAAAYEVTENGHINFYRKKPETLLS